jgi:hypothetical protein
MAWSMSIPAETFRKGNLLSCRNDLINSPKVFIFDRIYFDKISQNHHQKDHHKLPFVYKPPGPESPLR